VGPRTCLNFKILKQKLFDARSEVLKAMKIEVVVFWVVTPSINVVGYQSFGGPCCLHLQGEGIGTQKIATL
jgi:hypothetical protein